MIPLPAVAFLAFVCVACLLIEVWTMWARVDKLTDEMADLRHDLGLPEPLPAPRWWERVRDWLNTVPEPAEPVTEDTVESQAVVIGGARVVGKTAPTKAADWVEDDLAAIRARTAKRMSEGAR